MHKNGLAIISLFALALSSCVTAPPSQTGVALYRQGDFAGAYSELAPLAERGDAIAQYLVARMSLSGETATGLNTDGALGMLVNSAKQGNTDAYALLLLIKMEPQQRAQFRSGANSSTLTPGFRTSGGEQILRMKVDMTKTGEIAEAAAGGPISLAALLAMVSQADFIEAWPAENQKPRISNDALLSIDKARAKAEDKYAQLRLGLRYAEGRGVEKNEQTAFDFFMTSAASSNRAVFMHWQW